MALPVAVVVMLALTLHRPERSRLDPTQTIGPRPTSQPATQVRQVYRPSPAPAGFTLVNEQGGAAADVALPGPARDGPALGEPTAVYVLHYERSPGGLDTASDTIDVLTIDHGAVESTLPSSTSTSGAGVGSNAPSSAQIEEVAVGNHRAIIETTELTGAVRTVTWDETPEITIRIVAGGAVGRDELLAIAESVTAS